MGEFPFIPVPELPTSPDLHLEEKQNPRQKANTYNAQRIKNIAKNPIVKWIFKNVREIIIGIIAGLLVTSIINTDFDKSIVNINIIPQDIGRLLLNLYNNAFYAVCEKKKQKPEGYEPIVSVSTKKTDSKITISIKDNGNGIPQKIIDKIFQPFFTTKPTGQGTGLGLSLSYDIVKTHGGEIKVNSKEGEFTEFAVQLPITG
jgi:signal transduction histidine kinase